MNSRFGLTKKLVALFVLLSTVILLGAYLKLNGPSSPKKSAGANDATRPPIIAKAYFYNGGRCSVDSPEPEARSNLIAVSRKSPLAISGWVVEETTMGHQLPLAFVVLTGEHGTYYLEGKRVPRPDVATALGNKLFDQAGLNAIGSLTNISTGEYKLSLATGDKFIVAVCQTDFVVHIGD